MRLWIIGTLTILIAGILAGCGVAAPESASEGTTDNPIVLRVATGDSGNGLTPHRQIIEAFEAQHPTIKVQVESVEGRDYYGRLLTDIAAGTAADIIQVGDDALPKFIEQEAFVPLDGYLTGPNALDTGIYLPGILEPGRWQGQQYLLPKDYSTLAVFYNKKLFDEHGVAYPQDGWSWDDFLATAQALTKDTNGDGQTDVWGVQLPASWTTGFEYWVLSAGGALISPNGESFVGYLDSPRTVEAVQFYADLYNKHQVAPLPTDLNAFGGGNTEFEDGRAAMWLFGRWPQTGLQNNPNVELGVVGPPRQAKAANILIWGGFGIFSGSPNREAAWKFLRFYAGQEGAEVWKDWALPAVEQVAIEAGLTEDPIEGVWLKELNRVQPRGYTYTPYWERTADPAMRRVLEAIIIDPDANVAALLQEAALGAQTSLNDINR
ncbi:MAG: sugar ABC transporter substrate-binding protein [Anaerolineae bacterium]